MIVKEGWNVGSINSYPGKMNGVLIRKNVVDFFAFSLSETKCSDNYMCVFTVLYEYALLNLYNCNNVDYS